jgi:4-amino-4-deoxychorismate lyase
MYWFDGQWFDKEEITLSITEPGLLYGATIFTTLRVYQQSLEHPLTHWQAHRDRLQKSVEQLQWPNPDWQIIIEVAQALLNSYPVLRIVIFADGKIWITGRNLPENLSQLQQQGIQGWVADQTIFQRPMAAIKTGNYLTAWLALQEAQKQEAKEAILINDQGDWLETSTGNLWGWKEGVFYTPPEDGSILPGIMRSSLLKYLSSQGIKVQQQPWPLDWSQNLELLAYSNSVVEIIPFHRVKIQEKILTLPVDHPALAVLKRYFNVK